MFVASQSIIATMSLVEDANMLLQVISLATDRTAYLPHSTRLERPSSCM